ncbi:hypothetical protein H6503_03685 [Candidatus Woesearchaeota archaeon]|nr:hypothetical protein [Candidatus Woesearchaeota archaeon]
MSENIQINKKTLMIGLTVLILLIFGAVGMLNIKDVTATGNAVKKANGDYQEVTLKFENYEYQLYPSQLVKDVPVRMTVDLDSVYGCMRDIRIPAFGVAKYVKEGDNIIEFTPTQAGTLNIACSMNMGRGTFEVVDSSGEKADYVEAAPVAAAGTCGADANGGCGCGGA